MTVSAFYGASARVFLLHVIRRRLLKKNALIGDGCCWHAQHGLCHRIKNRIIGLMLCPPTHGTTWAAYRRLSHVPYWSNSSCTVSLSCHHVGRSRNASRVELCPNRRLWRCRRITWRSGGVVAFYRRSRPLMFAYDTDSGTNGRLTPLVGVNSNAISLNLGSSADAMQAKSRDVTAFANWKFEYREMTSQTKPKICHVSYSRLRNMPQTTWWWNV